jgi:anthraniloyl-CoA monooxygenase
VKGEIFTESLLQSCQLGLVRLSSSNSIEGEEMRIACIGGGPAGLYSSILFKKAFPDLEITIFEQNRPNNTFGWGVVFSDETLGNFEPHDKPSHDEILKQFIYWSEIETYYGDTCVKSTGHGFCGMSRKKLLSILQNRCLELGVNIEFETRFDDYSKFKDYDLVIASDGVNSAIRESHADVFKPDLDWRKCKFTWLGTDKKLEAFTFIFKENEHGLFQVHAYPFEDGLGTFIVECREEVWKKAGLDNVTEEETVAYFEDLFADDLDGHKLLNNRSIWRTFPTVRNETWVKDNIVLLGDSACTAHFSIGSGTKLAMESAIGLVASFESEGWDDVNKTLKHYEDKRWVDVLKLQKAAQTSLEWFENSARYMQQDPVQFSFNLMTRSKSITYDNLKMRDPELVAETSSYFRTSEGGPRDSRGQVPAPMFTPYKLRDMELANRIVVSPMCQYSAVDGVPQDWHMVHLGSRAVGGAGLIFTEMTNVSPEGRITPGCTGIWNDAQEQAWRKIVDFVHSSSKSKIGLQIAHAGRKGSMDHPWDQEETPLAVDNGGWQTVGPSAESFDGTMAVPKAMTRADMDKVVGDFVSGTKRAHAAGFDCIEVHAAHGYLLSSFVSPLSNHRTDEYGGDLDGRLRFPLEVIAAVRAAWPKEKPMAVRISASDWLEPRGTTIEDSVIFARKLQEIGCDVVDVSTAGNSMESKPVYGRMYQLPFAEQIRFEVGIPVMTVGAILGDDHANTVLAAGRADLVAMARPHLKNPYITLHAADKYEYPDQYWPGPYLAVKPKIVDELR